MGGILLQAQPDTQGFVQSGRTVVQGRVDGLKASQLRHQALVNPVRHQGSLTALWLIRGVGGGQVADIGNKRHHRVYLVLRQAISDKGDRTTVFVADSLQMVGQFLVFHLFGKFQFLMVADFCRNMVVQFLQFTDTDSRHHLLQFLFGCRNVMTAVFAGCDVGRIQRNLHIDIKTFIYDDMFVARNLRVMP